MYEWLVFIFDVIYVSYDIYRSLLDVSNERKVEPTYVQNHHFERYIRSRLIKAAGVKHNRVYSVNFVRIACSSENITVLGSKQVFYERIIVNHIIYIIPNFINIC